MGAGLVIFARSPQVNPLVQLIRSRSGPDHLKMKSGVEYGVEHWIRAQKRCGEFATHHLLSSYTLNYANLPIRVILIPNATRFLPSKSSST